MTSSSTYFEQRALRFRDPRLFGSPTHLGCLLQAAVALILLLYVRCFSHLLQTVSDVEVPYMDETNIERILRNIHKLRIHYLNTGYSKYVKVVRVHYFGTIALRTPFTRVSIACGVFTCM